MKHHPTPLPDGWFTEPVRAWKSMEFTSSLCAPPHPKAASLAAARKAGDEARREGRGFGNGTLYWLNRPLLPDTKKAPVNA